ncbi:MAG: phage tail tape measure protein [Ruminococcus sp.]|nr:phage tail tape measure protein [Ruminococcus sp.]
MAQTDGHLTFDTKINVDGFNEGTEKITNSLSKIGEQLKKLAESAVSAGDDFESSLKKMKDSSKEASEQSEKLAKNTKEYKEAVKDVGEETQKTAKSMSLLDFAGVQVFSNLATQAITKLGSKLKNLATSVLSTGIGFESSMSEVAAISGATDEELEKLTATAKEYGAATKFTAEESAQAFKFMALAGWDATQMTEALPGVLNLAASAGMDLAQASDIVTDYISAFGMETKDATYLADLLSYAQSNSNTTVDQLSEAYKNCASSMHSTGQTVETTTALLASMANQGYKGAEAGTSLTATMRDITDRMYKVTDETIKANEELKGTDEYISNLNESYGKYVINIGNAAVAVSDEAGNYKQLIDIMKDVEKVTGSMTEAERASELQSTFTRYSIKGVNMMLNAGVDSAAAFATELENSAGTAAKAAETMQDNVQGDLTKLSSAFDGLKLSVFEELKEPIRDVLQTLTKTLSDSKVKDGATMLGKSLGNMAKTLASKLPSAIDSVSKIVKFLWDNKGLVAGFASAFAVSKIMTFGGTAIKTVKNIVSAANPLTAIALGIGAAVALGTTFVKLANSKAKEWRNHLEEVREEAGRIPDSVQKSIDKTQECSEAWNDMKKSMQENISAETISYDNVLKLKDSLMQLINADGSIKEGAEYKVENILEKINEYSDTSFVVSGGVITDNEGVAQSYDNISDSIDKVIQKQHAQAQLDVLEDRYAEALKEKPELLESYTDSTKALNDAISARKEIYERRKKIESDERFRIETDINGDEYLILNTGANITEQEFQGIYQKWEEDFSKLKGINEKIVKLSKNKAVTMRLLNEISTAESDYLTAEKDFLNGNYENVGKSLEDFSTAIDNTTEKSEIQLHMYFQGVYNKLQAAKDLLKEGVISQEIFDEQKETVNKAMRELAETLDENGEVGMQRFLDAFKQAGILDSSQIDDVQAFIKEKLDDGESYSEIGKNIGFCLLNGLDIGLWEYAPIITKTASDVMSGAINAMNWMAEIHSPSRVTTRMGGYLDEGLDIGIEEGIPAVTKTSAEMMKNVLNEAAKVASNDIKIPMNLGFDIPYSYKLNDSDIEEPFVKDVLINQNLNTNYKDIQVPVVTSPETLQKSKDVANNTPDIFTNSFISRMRAIQQIPTEQIQRLVNATNNMANMQGLNSVAPYSSVYNNVYNNYSETNVNKSQSITNKSSNEVPPISLYATFELDGEQFGTAVLNEITRGNASTGGYSV